MRQNNIEFKDENEQRKYLEELERLRRIRRNEQLKMQNQIDESEINMDFIYPSSSTRYKQSNNKEIDIPNFNYHSTNSRRTYNEKISQNDYTRRADRNTSGNYRYQNTNSEKFNNDSHRNRHIPSERIHNRVNKETPYNKNRYENPNYINHNKKKKKRKKRIFPIFLLLLLIAFLGGVGYYGSKFLVTQTGYYNIAIFGVDSRDGNLGKGALADVDMICSINRQSGEIKLVSVYRDTFTEIDGKGTYHKLNEAYFKGGPEQAINAFERNLDIKIDDYATFNWKAVVDSINILGGVDVEITEPEFKYINSFITETVNSTGVGSNHLKAFGMQHLDGVQAVAYARLRLMDTDFNRTQRQRKIVSLAFEKAKQANFATRNNILVTVLPQISTSITLDDVLPFAKEVNKYHLGETTGFPFEKTTERIGKRDYVIPDTLKSNVIALHKFLYGEHITYTTSANVNKISAEIVKKTGIDSKKEIKADIDKNTHSKGSENKKTEDKAKDSAATQDNLESTESQAFETNSIEEEITESTNSNNNSSENQDMISEEGPGANLDNNYDNILESPNISNTEKEIGPGVQN